MHGAKDTDTQPHKHITKWVSPEHVLEHITAILKLTCPVSAYSSTLSPSAINHEPLGRISRPFYGESGSGSVSADWESGTLPSVGFCDCQMTGRGLNMG